MDFDIYYNSYLYRGSTITPLPPGSIPPIDRLPPEILSYIFLAYHDIAWTPQTVPMIVGLVCQRWRFVALNTSELWATLLLEGHGRDIAAYAPLINNWVAHSKNAPCHIKTMIWMDEESPISPLLYVFIPIASRIQTLDLTVELGELEQCLEFFKHGLPELRKIKIKLLYEMYGPEAEGLSLALDLSACPRLEEISFSDTIRRLLGQEGLLEGTPRSLKFYDHRITAEPVLAFAILYKCRTLEELRFTPPPISEWLERFDSKIKLQFTHTSLKRLSIQGTLPVHASDIQPLFQAVHFPALSDFELSDLAGSAGILRRLANTSPPLQSLSLNRCWLSTEDVIQVLEKIPSIKDLHLVGCGCHNELMIAALTAWRDGALLPNLERLNIGDDLGDELTVSDEDIVRFLESRWYVENTGIARITYVGIVDEREMGEEWAKRVAAMRSEGLDCVLFGEEFRKGPHWEWEQRYKELEEEEAALVSEMLMAVELNAMDEDEAPSQDQPGPSFSSH